jgi:integrase
MPRPRYQRGHVQLAGKREKKWKGFFYVYSQNTDGIETAKHRSVILGNRSEIRTKHEAEQRLAEIIERETQQSAQPGLVRRDATVAWFTEEVFVALRRSQWRSRKTAEGNLMVLKKHVLPALGAYKLEEVTSVLVQRMLDNKAQQRATATKGATRIETDRTYSHSLVRRMLILTRAILNEAVEQDYIRKNPARRCTMPATREVSRPALTPAQVAALLDVLEQRDRLIARLLSICALRAGELFGLRIADWVPMSDIDGGVLNIRQQITGRLKTKASSAPVVLTKALDQEIAEWVATADTRSRQSGLMFPSDADTPIAPANWLKRVLKPAAKKAGIDHITLHMFRRTYPTIGQHQQGGSVKDLQAQLRHARPDMTMTVYTQAVTPGVRAAAEYVEQRINEAKTA